MSDQPTMGGLPQGAGTDDLAQGVTDGRAQGVTDGRAQGVTDGGAQGAGTPVLELRGVNKSFHQRTADAYQALNDVNLTVNPGDFITIVGGNGAGKSTLFNTIAGSIAPDSGQVVLDGVDVTKRVEEERAGAVAQVFQDPKLGTAPRMTVAENLLLAAKRGENRGLRISMNASRREEFAELLKGLNLGLETRLDTEIGVLSGGQRQAIALLMATLKSPRVLLLDEHTAALDPKTARTVLELTEEMVETKHLTALMITHQLKDALALGNRMIVLHRGKLVRDVSAEEKASLSAGELYEMLADLEGTV